MKISDRFREVGEAFRISMGEMQKTRRFEHSQKVRVLMVKANGRGEWHEGKTDEGDRLLFIPLLMRVWHSPHKIAVSGEVRDIVLVHEDWHETLNLYEMGKIALSWSKNVLFTFNPSEKMRRLMGYYWKYRDDVLKFEIKDVKSTIDPQIFKNKYSASFTRFAFNVLQTKAFAFMEEPGHKTIIMIAVIAGLAGMLIGMVGAFIAYLSIMVVS